MLDIFLILQATNIGIYDNKKLTPDIQHSADLCGMLSTLNMCSSPEKQKDRSEA